MVGHLDFYPEVEGTRVLLQMAAFISVLRLNGVPLYGRNTFSLSLHPLMGHLGCLSPQRGYCEEGCGGHVGADRSLSS